MDCVASLAMTADWRVLRGCDPPLGRVIACHMIPAPPAREPTTSVASAHDKVLIVDFGSQVTQLIARRVREAGVYCEIAPFQTPPKPRSRG